MEGPKVTLEEYASFHNDVGRERLTVDQLNEIVFMHGFIRLHRRHKIDIINALKKLELMDPKRSTLSESIVTPSAPLTVEDVRKDLKAIGWEGCKVVSVKTFGSKSSSPSSAVPISSDVAGKGKGKGKEKEKEKEKLEGICRLAAVIKKKRGRRGKTISLKKLKNKADVGVNLIHID